MSDHTTQPVAEEIPPSEDEQSDAAADPTQVGEKKKKKKKSKKSKGKNTAASTEGIPSAAPGHAAGNKMSSGMVEQILKSNPSLAAETLGADSKMIQEMLGRLTVDEMLTGMVRPCMF